MAQEQSPRPLPLHPDQRVLAQSGRGLLRNFGQAIARHHRLPEQEATAYAHPGLHRSLEQRTHTFHLDQARSRHHPKSPANACAYLISGALVATLASAGCAASGTGYDATPSRTADAGGNGEPSANADAGSGGAQDTHDTGGKNGLGEIDTDLAGAGGSDQACAAEVSAAEIVPLDLYIMLDVSGSMLEGTSMFDATGTAITKWSAIKGALENFIADDASNGLGVGLQYFPLNKPHVPASCVS